MVARAATRAKPVVGSATLDGAKRAHVVSVKSGREAGKPGVPAMRAAAIERGG
jgi:hypothetical protein